MRIVIPLQLQIDPMERLLVASLAGDPEFEMIEPQVFDDELNGTGMRVLLYRRDGKVDVYWQAGVRVERKAIEIGAGIGEFMETVFASARFAVNETGVDLEIAFEDSRGRRVEIGIAERSPGQRGFSFLAPVGNDVVQPERLFLAQMNGFDFVRRAGTTVHVRIGDREARLASFPVLRRGHRVYFARYAAEPVVAALNPTGAAPTTFEVEAPGAACAHGMRIEVDAEGRTTRMSAGRAPRDACMVLSPGFPNLPALQPGSEGAGCWTLSVSGAAITAGTYHVTCEAGRAHVDLDVTGKWKPTRLPLGFKIFVAFARSFRTWPSTYSWSGDVDLERAAMTGHWMRKGRRSRT